MFEGVLEYKSNTESERTAVLQSVKSRALHCITQLSCQLSLNTAPSFGARSIGFLTASLNKKVFLFNLKSKNVFPNLVNILI